MRILFLLLFFTTQVWALESTDSFSTQFLRFYPDNIVLINRGLEDGIEVGDHVKIINEEEGFIVRALCLKRGLMSSHWKIYRIVRPGLVSKDLDYQLIAMNQSELPEEIRIKYLSKKFNKDFLNFDEKKLSKSLEYQQNRLTNSDLPKTNDNDPIVINASKTTTQKFIEKNFDKETLKSDLKNYQFYFFVSPFLLESRGSQKNINYGFNLKNDGDKYKINVGYRASQKKFKGPLDDTSFKEEKERFHGKLTIKNITEGLDVFSTLEYRSKRYNQISSPLTQLKAKVIGLDYHLINQSDLRFSLSYAPIFETRKDQATLKTSAEYKEKDSFLRHGILADIYYQFSSNFNLIANYKLEPHISDSDNNYSLFNLGLKYNFTKLFSSKLYYEVENDYYEKQILETTKDNSIIGLNFILNYSL